MGLVANYTYSNFTITVVNYTDDLLVSFDTVEEILEIVLKDKPSTFTLPNSNMKSIK